ncbi:hypothetical protein BFJ65_g18477 [Fusarium oxysporum f. sp. cepae]|uniref:Cytochrome P450 monooxygenase TRI13 n=2 Tax=Fusarium oxysporum TaxID=5507 RepID=A0A3L6MR85_FUSOX|nr:hypothetical protein BFJ65_g18477 [Fusarium oxysporum f. sp. cepae]RKK19110.1 hypothetical protein BFJ67_g17588 [Fusarium oxysporum f. sp. cepae]
MPSIPFLPSELGLPTHATAAAFVTAVAVVLYALYRFLLPKPLKGIPYNAEATQSLLGDIAAIQKESPNNPFGWMIKKARLQTSPVFQFFLLPFGKPCVLVSDFREAQDILMRRKEFERSDFSIDVLGGEAPKFHINLKTGPEWKAHRRLLQDLMAPKFLHNVAAPNIYKSASNLIELWKEKAQIAAGRPFSAEQDIFYTALDAVYDFGFGDGLAHRALIPQLERLRTINKEEMQELRDQVVEGNEIKFPLEPIHPAIEAPLASADNVTGVAGSGFPKLAWWFKGLQPKVKKMRALRDDFLKEQATKAVERSQSDGTKDEAHLKSAVDLMMQRERTFASKAGREPVYWSDVMKDEILGFIVAGHDTTSTTLCWGLKFLTDNPSCQTQLRKDLHAAYADALKEKRAPTPQEITESSIPYLDAVVEEMLRLSHTAPVQDRECTMDTTILGHYIPKGTLVFVANKGPTFTEPGYQVSESLRSVSCQNAGKERGVREWSEEGMEEFQPERWLTKDAKTEEEAFDSTAGPTMPFGLGLRGCFGRRLAYMELKLLTALLVWNFKLMPCPKALSSYEDFESLTRKPVQCFVNLEVIKK